MARPQKEGLEYFPLDVDIDQDDKLVVPIAKHGMLGLGVIVKLMMEVYKNGYYYPWTEKELYVFPFKIGVDSEKVSEIVIDCINSGFFCNKQYKRNQILTSYGFQKRFLLATTRRKDATINNRYLVQKELMSTETELLHTETKESGAESTQSKVKESESKDIKDIIPYKDIIEYLNTILGTSFKTSTKATKAHIKARFTEKFTLEDFKTVIDKKCKEWGSDPKMVQYLRPETLFGTKFESYLNQKINTVVAFNKPKPVEKEVPMYVRPHS